MGYNTSFHGELYITPSLVESQIEKINWISEDETKKRGAPGKWCDWKVTSDGSRLEWGEGEKFYNYIEWLQYLITNYFIPWGCILNGQIYWDGEENNDLGQIVVGDNKVRIFKAQITFVEETR